MQVPSTLPTSFHATAVAFGDKAVAITGASGRGKSTLAWQLIGLGAHLVSDDMVWLETQPAGLMVGRPPQAPEQVLIEARGVGLLETLCTGCAWVHLWFDLDREETERLPPETYVQIGPHKIRAMAQIDTPALPAILKNYLLFNTQDPTD